MKKTELLMLAICVPAAVSCGSRSAADKKSSSPESDGHDAFSTTKAKKEYLNDSGKAGKKKIATTDLFRYGDPVRCPEDNIRNLFTNWSGSGAESNGIHLLTYNYEGTAKNVRQMEKYVGHNQSAGMPYWNYCCNYEENKLHLETVKGTRKKQVCGNLLQELSLRISSVRETIHSGFRSHIIHKVLYPLAGNSIRIRLSPTVLQTGSVLLI